MQINANVVDHSTNEYMAKSGKVVEEFLVCMDTDPENPLNSFFDYKMQEDEVRKYGVELRGKKLTLGVKSLTERQGRIRVAGAIKELSK